MVREFTDANFATEVVAASNKQPVLVDFWAPWCGPCRIMGPVIENLAREIKNEDALIGKLNVDENSETASQFGIMSIPTIIVFKNGKPAAQAAGVQSIEQLKALLK